MSLIRAAALLLWTAAAACAPTAGEAELAHPTADFGRLADAYRRAHAARNVGALLALKHAPEGVVDDAAGKAFAAVAAFDFGSPIKSIRFVPIAPGERFEYNRAGVTYRPTLRPVGRMQIRFSARSEPTGRASNDATEYLLGLDNDRYKIVDAAPAGR